MTTNLRGADVEAVRELRTALLAAAAELERCAGTTSSAVDQLAWTGRDRTCFHETWMTAHRPALARVAEAVTRAADELGAQADDQELASSAAGAGGAASTTSGAPAPDGVVPPAATQGHDLGSLSRRYESNGDPGTVSTGRGDPGGVSYGMYQFATETGSAQEFVDGLRDTHPEHHAALAGLTPGTPEFGAAWRELAASDPDGFAAAQHDAIERTHYAPQLRATEARLPGLDFEERSPALRDVLWSTAVQHRNRTDDIFERALAGRDVTTLTDAEIIRAVYAERGRDDGAAYFRRSTPAVRAGVLNRFRQEERDALQMLGE